MYEYKDNLARLDSLTSDLEMLKASMSVHAQNYDTVGGFSGDISDPVGKRIEQIERLESEVNSLERMTRPITTLIKDLETPEIMENSSKAGLAVILKQFYINGNIWQDVADRLRVGRTVFFEKRRDLVRRAMWYLGV